MIRRTNRRLGGMTPRYRENAPVLSVGLDPDGEPIVVLTGGTQYRRAEGLSFADLDHLRELRADLDVVIREWSSDSAIAELRRRLEATP